MDNICQNCGRAIKVLIFKGTPWCSELCRKAMLGRLKCEYEEVDDLEVFPVDICVIHHCESKYPPERGAHRPCLAIEPY